jgi:hypothetical protein
MKDINKLIKLLSEANDIVVNNIEYAHNIDLDDMSNTLDNMIDELTSIGDFETFDDEEDDPFLDDYSDDQDMDENGVWVG